MGDLQEKQITVSIDGHTLHSFKSLRLNQAINDHHSFEILLDYEVGEVFQALSLGKSTQWLGKSMTITLAEKLFVGLVTQVGLHKSAGYTFLRINGFSSTYRLEDDVHFASWNDKTLEDIVSELTENANVQAEIRPERTAKLEYECQYRESNFGFIQRLAKQHFEWLYYDGEKLIFGKPELSEPVSFDSHRDLSSLDICIQTGVRPLSAYSHLSGANSMLNASSPDEPEGLNELGQKAFEQSLNLFAAPANHYAPVRITNKSELDTYLQKKQQADAATSHYITAECAYVGLMVGSLVEIKSSLQVEGILCKDEAVGIYIITEITHFIEGNGHYGCHFTGIPASIKTLPVPIVPLPVAQPQMATVISNDDPKKQGRVQVKMNWQINGMKSAWIRVLSPDAGGSDKVASNRGFVFIPEVGDQVMVAFRYNDPNRPYVQGSLFNGTNAGGGGEDNNVKSLTTRSGATVSLDDSKGSITIADPSGNVIVLDGNKNVTIAAVETLTLQAKDVIINGTDNVGISSTNIVEGANTISINAKDTTCIHGAKTTLVSSGENVHVGSGGEDVTVSSKETTMNSTGKTTVSASIINLNS